MNADESGELSCTEDSLSYRSATTDWSVRISEIRLIGEYTTANGPYLDDYFFVFMTAAENGWHEASFYAQGRDEALKLLAMKIGAPIEAGLCDSTDYKSRIVWPTELNGKKLMEVIPRKLNFWQRLIDSGERDIKLSAVARKAFEQGNAGVGSKQPLDQ